MFKCIKGYLGIAQEELIESNNVTQETHNGKIKYYIVSHNERNYIIEPSTFWKYFVIVPDKE